MTAEPTRRGFAGLLWRLADLLQATETRRSFRARAYRGALWALDDLSGIDASDEELLSTPGIGPGVTALVNEYRSTGHINQLTPLERAYPRDALTLRRLPRMSPKLLRDLKRLGVETASDLALAVESGAAATLKGIGPQTLGLWIRILGLAPGPGLVTAHRAWDEAGALAAHLSEHTPSDVHVGGAVRRVEEWVEQIDLVIATTDFQSVVSFLDVTAVFEKTAGMSTRRYRAQAHSGMLVEIHICPPHSLGNALFVATGPPAHVLDLGEVSDQPSEADLYRSVELPVIPPAARGLPVDIAENVVRVDQMRGDLHLHSEASPDGRLTLKAILAEAMALGYEYVLITDHTQGLRFGGLGAEELTKQARAIEQLRSDFTELTVFHGAELNIGREGELDLSDEAVSQLDFAVAGIHSHFGLDRDEQTERILSALRHPVVKILAHPFGRRIGIRPPIDLEMEAVIAAAVAEGVALETNGHRDRLDLPADWIAHASSSSAWFAANSDAHRLGEMTNISNAVATLQRAGVGPEQVINTWDRDRLSNWVRRS